MERPQPIVEEVPSTAHGHGRYCCLAGDPRSGNIATTTTTTIIDQQGVPSVLPPEGEEIRLFLLHDLIVAF